MHECNVGDGGNMRGNNHAQELNTLNCPWLIPRHLESQVQTVSEGISLIVLAEHYKVLIITQNYDFSFTFFLPVVWKSNIFLLEGSHWISLLQINKR